MQPATIPEWGGMGRGMTQQAGGRRTRVVAGLKPTWGGRRHMREAMQHQQAPDPEEPKSRGSDAAGLAEDVKAICRPPRHVLLLPLLTH